VSECVRRWIRAAIEHGRLTVAVVAVLTAAWIPFLPGLRIQADGRSLLARTHPAVVSHERLEREFGGADFLTITLEAPTHAQLFAPPALTWLYRFTRALETLPAVGAGGVRSLATEPIAVWTPGGLSIAPAVVGEIATETDAAAVRRAVERQPTLERFLMGADRRSLAVYVPVRSDVDRRQTFAFIEELARGELHRVAPAGQTGYTLRFLGAVAAESLLAEYVLQDLVVLLPAGTLLTCLILYLWFRDWRMAALGFAEAIVCVVWTLGLMAVTERPLTLVGVLGPVILVAYGVSDTIYIAQRFRECGLSGRYVTRQCALQATMEDLTAPLAATSATTCAGFLAFAASPIPPLRDFGLFTAFGVALALALSLLVVPAVLLIGNFRENGAPQPAPGVALGILHGARVATRRPDMVIAACVLLVGFVAAGAVRIRIQDSWLRNFNASSSVARADAWFNDRYAGSNVLNATFRADGANGVYDPRFLSALERVQHGLRGSPAVGDSFSVLDCLNIAARVLEGAERRPATAHVAAEWALVYETGDAGRRLRSYVNEDRSGVNVSIFLNRADYARTQSVMNEVRQLAQGTLLAGAEPEFAGDAHLGYVLVRSIAGSLWITLGLSGLLVFAIAYTLVRSASIAVHIMVPVVLAVVCNFGFMGWVGMPIGVATSTFAAIAVGIGIDFAIQWTARLRGALAAGMPWDAAVESTQRTTGAAILLHSTVLVASFSLLTASAAPPNRSLGVLVCVNLIACMLATLLVLPALGTLAKRRELRRALAWRAVVEPGR
jgi:predicted RND superfamily exporter protein